MDNETSNTIDYQEISSNIINESNLFKNKINQTEFYLQLVAVPVGVIGNLVSIFIFTRPKLNRKTNTGFLYTILCIFYFIYHV